MQCLRGRMTLGAGARPATTLPSRCLVVHHTHQTYLAQQIKEGFLPSLVQCSKCGQGWGPSSGLCVFIARRLSTATGRLQKVIIHGESNQLESRAHHCWAASHILMQWPLVVPYAQLCCVIVCVNVTVRCTASMLRTTPLQMCSGLNVMPRANCPVFEPMSHCFSASLQKDNTDSQICS